MSGVLRNSGQASINEGTNDFHLLFILLRIVLILRNRRIDLTMSSACLVSVLWKLVVLIVFNRTVIIIIIARMVTVRCCGLRICSRS